MKKIIVVALALVCSSAFAGSSGDQCFALGLFAQAITASRNLGHTPQDTFKDLSHRPIGDAAPPPDSTLKNMINTIYFDQSLQYASPTDVFSAVTGVCAGRIKPMHPLQ